MFGTVRTVSGEMGHMLVRLGVVDTRIQISNGRTQHKTNPAFGLGWGAMMSGSLGFEITGTGIFAKIVGTDDLSIFGIRLLYTW